MRAAADRSRAGFRDRREPGCALVRARVPIADGLPGSARFPIADGPPGNPRFTDANPRFSFAVTHCLAVTGCHALPACRPLTGGPTEPRCIP